MKINSKNLGLVTKKFKDFFLVDLKNQENSKNCEKFLCKVRKSINFKDQLIYVGDEVIIELDKGEPEEMVLKNLKEMGCLFKLIKENEKFIKIKILNEN